MVGQPLVLPEASRRIQTGLHLAQIPGSSGIQTAWLAVAGDTTLVLPERFRRPVLERMTDAAATATAVPQHRGSASSDFHAVSRISESERSAEPSFRLLPFHAVA